jgi:hypothetical protein
MGKMASMRKIQTNHIHTSQHHFSKGGLSIARWTYGANNFRFNTHIL